MSIVPPRTRNANGFFIAASAYHLLTGKARSLSVSGCEAVGYVLGGTCLETGLCRLWIGGDVATKRCSTCGQYRDVSDFGPDKRSTDGLRYECKPCRRAAYHQNAEAIKEQRREYYKAHSEQIKSQVRSYRERNPDKTAQANRSWAERNAAKVKAYLAEWRERNAERMKRWDREYREKNADKIRVRERTYYDNNPQKERQKKHTRRARVRNASGKFTAAEWADLKARYNHTCLCCGKREPEIQLTPDHVVSLKNGGTNDIGNIQPLCKRCNSSKGSRDIDYR